MTDLTIAQLQLATMRRNLQWDPTNSLSMTFRATELAGETGELCNVIKKIERERLGLRGSRASTQNLADEIGDVLICLCLLANTMGVDLQSAVRHKFNESSEKLELAERL